jgi:hypothetical protein
MVREHALKPREALVLYALVSYADARKQPVIAYPSLRTLALDCGYKPTRYETTDKRGRTRAGWKCSSVSAAIDRLQELRLVWTTHEGRGQNAIRELLYRPETSTDAAIAEPPAEEADDLERLRVRAAARESLETAAA